MRLWGARKECECCKVLKEEVSFLRSLLRPVAAPKFDPLPVVHFEADAVLNSTGEQFTLSTEDLQQQEELDAERARILSGTY